MISHDHCIAVHKPTDQPPVEYEQADVSTASFLIVKLLKHLNQIWDIRNPASGSSAFPYLKIKHPFVDRYRYC
ncbi:hypothetical protein T11_11391 [Trichinella zimbabwensis]|uniref:Uncharacterized protein n=1 Tax=Trichinella zimbabwensis TaxID=268475 RepID=A0A0V1HLM3_9BILA|nr:hypothetical protein T11_11391 [Trichinella zimbabwensis]